MKIGHQAGMIYALPGVQQAADSLYQSMNRLSQGKRLTATGDAPADYGIVEQMQYQIQKNQATYRNLEDARNLISTADAWLQSSHGILQRMAELATAARDSSKAPEDQVALQTEYAQLKAELQRIGREASYSGVQVAGRDQILSYDQDAKTFFFSQLDGGEAYYLNNKVQSGIQSNNSVDFLFDPAKDYTKSDNGRYIFYVDSNDHLVKYDIDGGALTRSTADSADKGIEVDNHGRLWYAAETAPASGVYGLRQMDIDNWSQDATMIGNSDIVDMGSKEFTIYEDRIYYMDSSNNVVSRDLTNVGDFRVELRASDHSLNTTAGQFALSEDGQFIADVSAPGVIRVTNVETRQTNTFNAGGSVTVTDLTFSVDNGEIAFVNSTDGSIHRVTLELGDTPGFGADEKLHIASGGSGFSGLSLDGGSHRARMKVQAGGQGSDMQVLLGGDVRLYTLGLSHTKLGSVEAAADTLAAVNEAINRVSVQRSALGAQESRITETHEALVRYVDNLSMAQSGLRDVDMAAESAQMMSLQVRYQAATSLLAQANQQASTVLRLLNN
jgi:flagellin